MQPQNRNDDIAFRGDINVHDYDGSIKPLSQAKVWYNYDGDYVPPRTYITEDWYRDDCCLLHWLHNILGITI